MSSILCPNCGYVSHNANDVEEKYCGNCEKFHADFSPRKLPLWVQRCTKERRRWVEDDAIYMDKYNLESKWLELFGEELPKRPALVFDDQDNIYYLYTSWRVARVSGTGETAIYQLQPEDTWQKS